MRAVLAAFGVLLGFFVLGPLLLGGARSAQKRVPEPTAAKEVVPADLPDARAPATSTREGEPVTRFESGDEKVALYVPRSITVRDGRFDLVVHFHGGHEHTTTALDRAELGAVMVTLNIGEGGTTYADAAASADFLDRLVAFAEHGIDGSGRFPGGRVGRIAVSSWSAGFGAVRAMMNRPNDVARITGLLLADGLFTDWNSDAGHRRARANEANLEKVAGVIDFARRATLGDTLFVLTHTSIDRRDYADAPDIAEAMIRRFDLEKVFPDEPSGSTAHSPNYAADKGSFHIWSFGGKTWADHLAQLDALRKHFSALKAFWSET